MFKHLFPDKNLLPKHHFMVHYPSCMQKIGPLIHCWCMRYEAKHNVFKKQLKSFKNITKTLAKKHQYQMAYIWQTFDPNAMKFGPGKMVPLNEMEVGTEMAGKLNVSTWTKVLNVKWVKHCGNTYRSGLAVCVQVQNDMPVFHVIQNIVIKDEHILLITTALKTLLSRRALLRLPLLVIDGNHHPSTSLTTSPSSPVPGTHYLPHLSPITWAI